MNYFQGETPDNYEQKCLCVLVLDTSGSMAGEPIKELNRGLSDFYDAVLNDMTAASRLEIMIISFGSEVQVVVPPSLVDNFRMPKLQVEGSTRLADAVNMAMTSVEERKNWYKATGQPYYRPIVVLITDGEPDYSQDIDALSVSIRNAVASKKFTFFGLGVRGYNRQKLAQICPPQTPPLPLNGYRFSDFFLWLSNSISIITKSREGERIDLPPTSGWTQMEI